VRGRRRPDVVLTVDHGRRELDLTALAWLLRRYRHHLAPPYCGVLLWLAGLAAHHGLDRLHAISLFAGCAIAASAWAWLRLDRGIERAYAVIVLAEATAWLITAQVLGPTDANMVRLLVIGSLIAAVPWWAHRRVRSQVRVERAIAAWPTVAESVGLAGSKLINVVVSTWGWTGRLVLRGGQTIRDVHKTLRGIESGLRLPIGSVRAEPWHDRADIVVLRVVESDPHALPVVWPGSKASSIAARLPIGLYDDGQVCDLPLYDCETGTHHALVSGTNGSGKSGLLNLAAAHAATAPDALLWGIDLKGGIELRPWAPVCDWLATTTDHAAAMLAALRRIVDARGQAATQWVWQASQQHPVIVVLIDEAAELPTEATADLDSIARRGRALGVQLTLATQYPTAEAVGSTQVRAQLRTRAAFRFQRSTEAAAVLSRASGTDPATIAKNRPGCCYIEAAGAERPAMVRCYWISDEHVTGVVQVHQDSQPALDAPSTLAAGPDYTAPHCTAAAPGRSTPQAGQPPGPTCPARRAHRSRR
jgi:S-DNA-T family DNA segregation ATPase FtsK/SpoIIIE